MCEYDIERDHREHLQPPKQKSILEKDRQTQFFHEFGAISKASKVLTSEMKDQFQRIFLSSDPDNDEIKALIHDCFYMTWLTGAFLPDFTPELADSYLIALEKPNGGITGIAPVDIWRR